MTSKAMSRHKTPPPIKSVINEKAIGYRLLY